MDQLCDRQNDYFKFKGINWAFNSQKSQLECRALPELKAAEDAKRRKLRGREGTMVAKPNKDIKNKRKMIEQINSQL